MSGFSEDIVNGESVPDNITHLKIEGSTFRYNGSYNGRLIDSHFHAL